MSHNSSSIATRARYNAACRRSRTQFGHTGTAGSTLSLVLRSDSPGYQLDQPTRVKEIRKSRQIDCNCRCEEARVEQHARIEERQVHLFSVRFAELANVNLTYSVYRYKGAEHARCGMSHPERIMPLVA